jgi:hypothetical protein
MVSQEITAISWNTILLGAGIGAVIFGLICRALTAWLFFKPADILNILTRGDFGSYWVTGAIVGFFIGIVIFFFTNSPLGSLLPEDACRDALIIVSTTLVLYQIAGVLGVYSSDEKNIRTTLAYINEWKRRSSSLLISLEL